MENILFFLAGFAIASIAAIIIAGKLLKARAEQTRSACAVEQAKLISDLQHAKNDTEIARQQIKEAKDEADIRLAKAKEEWEESQGKAIAEMKNSFNETVLKMQAQLKLATADMLKERQEEFSKSSNESIGKYLDTVKEAMKDVKEAVEKGDKNLTERTGAMKEQIETMMTHSEAARKSADELATALKHGSKVQGDWGEMKLAELLTSQGLTEGIHFDTQSSLRDTSGNAIRSDEGKQLRPDVILHLDDRREVIIDSKVSLTAYFDYMNAETEEARQLALKAHLASVLKHVNELSKKDYSAYVKSPKVSAGYVIMFVPNSGALWTALNADPKLWRNAADSNVYICDEQSLYGALKIVSLTWTQISQAQNHEKVFALADEMIKRVGMFKSNYESIGKALSSADKAYQEGCKKLEERGQSIIGVATNLISLGAKQNSKYPVKSLYEAEDIPVLHDSSENNA